MADLKSGTTIGGNTVFTQGNLPIVPSGNLITYRGWRIYTEQDKPNNVDVGLGNVTNDAQVKKSGDTMTGALTVANAELNVGYRINLIRDASGYAPYLAAARSDNLPKADGTNIPTSNRESFNIQTRTASPTSNSTNGALLGYYGVYEKANSGGGYSILRSYMAPSVASDGSLTNGAVGAEIIWDADAGEVKVTKGTFIAGVSQFTDLLTTTTNVVVGGSLTVTNVAGINLTGRNSGIDIGSLTESGTAYLDFHTTGTNVDYDYRLSATSSGIVLDSSSAIGNYDVNFSKARDLLLKDDGATGIKTNYGNYMIRDHGNGNVTISASLRNRTDTTGGTLYLGYNSPSGGFYTSAIRLEVPMTWQGQSAKTLVNSSGQLVSTQLDGGALTGSTVTSNGTTTSVGLVTAQNGLQVTGGALNVAGTSALNVVTASDITTTNLTINGSQVSSGAIASNAADTFRIRGSSKSVFQRFDSSNWFLMVSDTVDGSWNSLRPFYINTSSGLVTLGNGAQLNANMRINWGGRGHVYQENGDIVETEGSASIFRNVSSTNLSGALNWLRDRSNDAWNKSNDAQVNRVVDIRYVSGQDFGIVTRNDYKWLPGGWVCVGLWAAGNETIQNLHILGARLQIYRNGGWLDSST